MAPENELLSSWREELRQQASQGSGREELEGGGEEQEGEIEMLDENSNVEKTIKDSDSEEQFRASLSRETNRKKKRQRRLPVRETTPQTLLCWRHHHAPAAALDVDYYVADF